MAFKGRKLVAKFDAQATISLICRWCRDPDGFQWVGWRKITLVVSLEVDTGGCCGEVSVSALLREHFS